MINKPPPAKGLNIRIPGIIPLKGRGAINSGVYSRAVLVQLGVSRIYLVEALSFKGLNGNP